MNHCSIKKGRINLPFKTKKAKTKSDRMVAF